MTELRPVSFTATDLDALAKAPGRIAVFVPADGKLSPGARRLNKLCKGALERAVGSERFEKLAQGDALSLAWPAGLEADGIDIVKLDKKADTAAARKSGSALARAGGSAALTVLAEARGDTAEIVLGLVLRSYRFTRHKSDKGDAPGAVTIHSAKPDAAETAAATALALAEGVSFTRDLVNEPANVLTTSEFAARLVALSELGIEVEVLEEDHMRELGMGSFLSVSQGSESPAKLVVMRWKGGGDEAPLALVGKGVVFDTGGISLKPSAGMETMTMDMGGAGVVAGTMRALARRNARANVTGLVGLVENMPDGRASRPGDIVTSMKGDTIEIVNTDAEGRLVLADVLWYAQETEKPAAMIDLATLTGACIVALGHDHAAVLGTDDGFTEDLLAAAKAEGEGAWRMPFGPGYADLIKTPLADVKNSGGRPAGTLTAAEFLKRFVKDDLPWCHIDIAGVAHVPKDQVLSAKGATGWGVLTLNRLIAEHFEQG
ncbi:leucyl aminopeptidase [Litorisediminicola beolgyonensis]|uniref:Probable cytosol aminopeptidase n=1 Tax=Litorisediminicola beolgyonensis TaxID=1173614 RepID=A0ABW3ZJU2_9RHOB